MKKNASLNRAVAMLLAALFLSSYGFSQIGNYVYPDSWGQKGLRLVDQRSAEINLTYSITDFQISEQLINGKQAHQVLLSSHFLPNDAGAPNLPGNGQYIAIPNGAKASFEIVNSRIEIIQNVDVAPAPVIPLDTDKNPLKYERKSSIYLSDAFYPANPVVISPETELRGLNMVMLGVTPYQYNPITKELKVWRDIEIKINIEGGNGQYGTNRLRNRWWDPILRSTVINPGVLADIDYNKRVGSNQRSEEYEYLIITPNDEIFVNWADSIRLFRTMQGIHTGVVTLGEIGPNNPAVLENYIDEIYMNWAFPPAAVLLLGDYGTSSSNSITSPIYNSYCASDNILADINNDHLPDIVFARMTAQNEEQLEVMIRKFIEYETNPPTSYDFYNHPITALGWQTERWFQICSESVGGFWKNELGKEPVRINEIYDGNPDVDPWSYAQNTTTVMNYFGPNGLGYLPATPGELGNWSGGNASDINNAINDGAFMLQHRDHGNEAGWGEPGYNRNSINGLSNTDLTFVFSINCLTGKYNSPQEVFTEKFHRYTHDGNLSGALGLNAASEVSYSFVNDTYVWGMFDYMWPEFLPDYGGNYPDFRGILPAFASAYGKIFLDHSGWPYNTGSKEVTYNLFHHHGDAFLNVYTEVPQDLTVVHEDVLTSGEATFAVTADLGAIICLSVGGEIVGLGEGNDAPVDIPVGFIEPGQYVDVVVTKQNYFRYHERVLAIPPSGPYLLKLGHSLNDIQGNQNGQADYDESLLMSVSLKNVGIEIAEDVTVMINTQDTYINLIDDSENLSQIDIEELVVLDDAFSFSTTDNIPDQHSVEFEIVASSGDHTWTSTVSFIVNAPSLLIQGFEIIEVVGNMNGIVDPGETASLVFTVENNGHCQAKNLASTLESNKDFANILNAQTNVDLLDTGAQAEANFVFEVDGFTPIGDEIIFSNKNICGSYQQDKDVFVKIGVFVEDWETANMLKFDWLNPSEKGWQVVEDVVYEGANALRSGHMAAGDFCMLSLSYKTFADDSISFYKKIDTEAGKGELIFIIDGTPQDSWTGQEDWNYSAYPLPAGNHIFSWIYMYNVESEITENCAWIDLIRLPQNPSSIVWAGADEELCGTEDIQLEGLATYYETLAWTSTGSGSFSNANALNAIYHPSQDDVNNESIALMLSIESSSGDMMMNDMKLSFMEAPGMVEISTEMDTVMPVYTESSTFTGTESAFASSYLWTIEPQTAGDINFDGQTCHIVWNPSYSGELLLSYCGINDCGNGSMYEKTIQVVDAIGIEENKTVKSFGIYPNPTNRSFNLSLQLSQKEAIAVRIVNATGMVVWQQDYQNRQSLNEKVDVSQLSKGVYFIAIEAAKEKSFKKLVIH